MPAPWLSSSVVFGIVQVAWMMILGTRVESSSTSVQKRQRHENRIKSPRKWECERLSLQTEQNDVNDYYRNRTEDVIGWWRARRDVTRLVDEGVAAIVKPPNNRIYTEVLRQLHTCQTFASDFEGRTEVTLTAFSSSSSGYTTIQCLPGNGVTAINTPCPEKRCHYILPLILPNTDRFSELFHGQT